MRVAQGNKPDRTLPVTEMIALGNLAVRAGRTLELDAATGSVKSPTVPNEWLMPSYRAGWSLAV